MGVELVYYWSDNLGTRIKMKAVGNILIILLTIIFFAVLDAYLFSMKVWYEGIAHFNITIVRISIFVLIGFFIDQLNWRFLLSSFLLFVALFDYLLNFFRGLPIFHLGQNAAWDVFWTGKEVELMILKVICGLVGILLLIRDDED